MGTNIRHIDYIILDNILQVICSYNNVGIKDVLHSKKVRGKDSWWRTIFLYSANYFGVNRDCISKYANVSKTTINESNERHFNEISKKTSYKNRWHHIKPIFDSGELLVPFNTNTLRG